jgi:hypothetical protein
MSKVRIRSIARLIAGSILLALPLATHAKQTRGTTGSASAVEFPDL